MWQWPGNLGAQRHLGMSCSSCGLLSSILLSLLPQWRANRRAAPLHGITSQLHGFVLSGFFILGQNLRLAQECSQQFCKLPLLSPKGEPTDKGLLLWEFCLDPQPGTLPPSMWENPMVPEMGKPGGRPNKVLSCLVIGEAQPLVPNNSDSLGGGASIPSMDTSNGGMLAGVGEKLGRVCGPGSIVCELGAEFCGIAKGSNMDDTLSSQPKSCESSFGTQQGVCLSSLGLVGVCSVQWG